MAVFSRVHYYDIDKDLREMWLDYKKSYVSGGQPALHADERGPLAEDCARRSKKKKIQVVRYQCYPK